MGYNLRIEEGILLLWDMFGGDKDWWGYSERVEGVVCDECERQRFEVWITSLFCRKVENRSKESKDGY